MAALALTGLLTANANADDAAENAAWNRAVQDAARQTAAAMAADARIPDGGRIAFVRLKGSEGAREIGRDANVTQVFEAALVSDASRFPWVTHAGHEEEWRLIDGVFDQAGDFADYDPATHPELRKLALADALLIGQVVGATADERTESTVRTVQIALRVFRVDTGEELWGRVVEGRDTETHARLDAIKEEAMGWLTARNIAIGIGVLLGVLVLLGLFKAFLNAATRVR